MIVRSLKNLSSNRVRVVFDDNTEAAIPMDLVVRNDLFSGTEVLPDRFSAICAEAELLNARDRALSLISYRPHSEKEVRDKLRHKGFSENAAEYAVKWLTERNYLDDCRFAEELTFSYLRKEYGKRRIHAELVRRGVARDTIHQVLKLLESPAGDTQAEDARGISHRKTDEHESCLMWQGIDRYLEKHLPDPDDRENLRKIKAALFRKGFSSDEITSAVERFRVSHDL